MRKIFSCLLFLFGVLVSLNASEEVFCKHLRGLQIAPNAKLTIPSWRYNQEPWNVVAPSAKVRLYIAEDRKLNHLNSAVSVAYSIVLRDVNQNNVTVYDTLSVNFHNSNPYRDLDVNEYPGYKAASLKITNVTGPLADDIILELQIYYPIYAEHDTLATVPDVRRKYIGATNELLVTWGYVGGSDEYDLEWLFIDNPTLSNNVTYDFANATRITTSNNYYKIPLAYPKGNVLCRVRGRGTHYAYGEYFPVFGPWSFVTSSGNVIPDSNHICRYDFAGLEDSLTWQYTAVYAEEGKRKEVITFYDGSLRSRQEVTVLNTDSIAVVGETFYDHIGRQALQSLPTPTPSRGVRYYGTAGSSNGLFNGCFPKSLYDSDTTIVDNRKFPADAGSVLYHSTANPFANNPHWPNINQTPRDSGYAYTHVRYLNDGTDRVHSQSAVGSTFKMGSGHETKYLYGNPTQKELDRLFGNEVGDASHYQKVIAIDPNGEATVSYYDMKERLIASAIIPSATETTLLKVDDTPLSHRFSDSVSFNETSRQYVQNIVVGELSTYTFNYVVSPSSALCDTCQEQTGCMDCRYKVVFSLWNPDILGYLFKDSLIVSEGTSLTHSVDLTPGSYQLYKSITLAEDDMLDAEFNQYRDRQRGCVPYTKADTMPCYTSCEEYAMWRAGIDKPDLDDTNYVRALDSCQHPPQNFNTECEAKRAIMLADMSPGGQYFDNIRTCCPGDTVCSCETKPNNFLNTICTWRFKEDSVFFQNIMTDAGCVTYKDTLWEYMRDHWTPEYAEVMLRYHPEYHLYQALCDCGDSEAQQIFDSIFMNTYDFHTADSLGLFNPLGLEIDENTEMQTDPSSGYQPFRPVTVDPFFNKITACCSGRFEEIYQGMVERLFSYLSWKGEYASVWWLLLDPDSVSGEHPHTHDKDLIDMMNSFQEQVVGHWAEVYQCSKDDARWLLFKSIYTYLKEEIRRTVLPACFLDCDIHDSGADTCCHNIAFHWGQQDWWSDYFDPDLIRGCDYYLATDTGCHSVPLTDGLCLENQGGFQIRFLCNPVYGITLENLEVSTDTSLQVVYDNCCEECETYANSWMEELHDYLVEKCSIFEDDSTRWFDIRQKLINWCVESCDSSKSKKNFDVIQRISWDSLEILLGEYCELVFEEYPRIVYPRPENLFVDCGCNNYQNVLHSYGLTFWDDAGTIADSLRNEEIFAATEDIGKWNGFCIWRRYDNLKDGFDDTASLYSRHFPEQFRCQPDLPDSVICRQRAILAAAAQDTISFYRALDSLITEHRARYSAHCMDNLDEYVTIAAESSEFLYTLYYYDQADNLIKTVPPEGVHPITDNNLLEAVAYYRNNVSRYDTLQASFIRPNHTMVTNYRYNSLNQVTQSYLPDYDGVSYVYYDILSRPVLSQDGKQRQQHKYSYTVYDSLGHIVEVGQIQNGTPVSREKAADTAFFNLFLNSGVKSEITKTRYDSALVSSLDQTHLRNRIAAVSFYPTDVSDYQSATHYSYDIHGNVKRLVQEIPDLNLFGRQFTTLDYEYDLISGNVNAVWFQKGELEQFAHRYRYDADNRITHVYTSNLFKKNDTTFLPQERLEARYFYLPDGAMSRVELGHKQIQGIDYAYTLQGWLKDINGYRSLFSDVYDLLSGYDMGNDGSPVTGNLNSVFPWDAFSSSIQYYQGDYQPVVGTNYFNCPSTSAVPLYNGNISALTTSYHNSTNVVLMKLFRYDKLNRIKQMQTAEQFQSTSGWEPVSDNYSTEYEYDWNGNLLSLRRNDKYGQIMHDIAYHYPNAANNRLGSITATGLNSGSYQYDAIGNLVRDNAEGLAVEWNAMGKVDSICRNGNLLSRFRYSPTGQRQVKVADGDTLFYIHDATGNVICVYLLKNDTLSVTERYMYGSKRLGMLGQQVWIVAGGTAGMSDSSTIGARTYELTDHLGNVTATILDRKRPVLNSYGNMVYIPLIVSYTDYYPFGYPISDRSYYNGGYRYFFNGQEADNEVLGEGVLHAFEYRMHDTRIGRFWSVDPLAGKFPWNSVYAFAENRVVDGKELEGLEFISVNNSGVNPEAYENSDGTYNLSFGDIDFNNVSMTEFNGNNYFDIGQHLYYDKNGWNTIGTKENRITEWPNRPKFEDMWGNLPSKDIKAPELIRGMVKFNFDNNPKSFSNTCAIRMSRALNYSNSPVTPLPTEKTKGRAGTGADKKWYYYGVTELNSYLNRTFGPPDLTINSKNLRENDIRKIIQNETGIIFFRVSGWDDAVGHFDMWNGHSVKNSEYFNPSGNASLYEIDLWFLDGQ